MHFISGIPRQLSYNITGLNPGSFIVELHFKPGLFLCFVDLGDLVDGRVNKLKLSIEIECVVGIYRQRDICHSECRNITVCPNYLVSKQELKRQDVL
jgi:hypothetical protein